MSNYWIINKNKVKKNKLLEIEIIEKLDILTDGTWLLGGAIRCIFDKTPLDDFDLFFKNREESIKATIKFEKDNWKLVFKCPLGYLTTFKKDINGKTYKAQLITKQFYDNPMVAMESFDFNACLFGYFNNCFYLNKHSLKDVVHKRLKIFNLTYPVATINRLIKYRKKGYVINDAIMEIVNRLLAANEVDFNGKLQLYID